MARLDNQITLADVDPEYQGFLDKFKPKKTTDDCYTPDNIYSVVLKWVIDTYGIDPDKVVRPFWPGGDYMNEDYPEGCTVVDNPPFSIVTQICKTYNAHGVKYFLFAPYLTNFNAGAGNRPNTHHCGRQYHLRERRTSANRIRYQSRHGIQDPHGSRPV